MAVLWVSCACSLALCAQVTSWMYVSILRCQIARHCHVLTCACAILRWAQLLYSVPLTSHWHSLLVVAIPPLLWLRVALLSLKHTLHTRALQSSLAAQFRQLWRNVACQKAPSLCCLVQAVTSAQRWLLTQLLKRLDLPAHVPVVLR